MCDSQHQGPGGGRSYALPPTLSTSTVAAAAPPQYPPPALRPRAVAALTLDAATAAASPSLDVSSSSSSGGGGAVDVIWSPPPAAAAFSTLAAPSASAAVPSSDSLLSIISEAAAVDGGITAEVGMGVGVCATVGGIASAGTPPKAVFVRGNPVLSVGSDGKAEVSTKLVRPKEIFDPGQPQQSVPMSTASFDDASSIAALDPGASTATGAAAIRKSFAPISLPSPALDLASTAQVPLQQVPFSSDSLLHHQRIFSGHHYQENKWPKPCKPDVAGGASFRGLGSFTSPSGAASPWSSLSANDDVVDPTLNPVGGADDVLEEPIDVTLDAAAGGIFSGIITSSAPSPVAVSTKTIKPLVIPGSVDNSQLLQQSQQQALRLVSAAAAVPVPIAVPPPTLQAANTTSTITVPRISVEQGAPATIATVPLDSISVTGVGNDFAAPNACTSSAAGAIRLIPEAAAPTTGIVSSSVLPPVAVANVSAAPALTNVSAVRLVPSSVPSSASASGPPSRAAQVRILPDEFKHPAQATSQQRRKDVKVVSVLNLSASNAQQQTVSVSPQGTPLPTVVLKPIVQNTRSSSTSAQRRPSAVISSSASVTRSSASSRRPRQEIGASLSQPSQHLQASPQSTDPRVESVSCFKCRECGFLGLSARAVEEHCLLEHEEQEAATLHNAEGTSESGRQQPRQRRGGPQQQVRPGARRSIRPETSTSWLAVAIQEGVKLQCPLCSNQFSAESSRSFIVHVTDDHGKDDGEAEALFQEQRDKRRVATIEALRSKRRKERERRRRAFPEEQGLALEAYIDGASGDLRVRTCSGDTVGAVRAEGKAENNAELDLSAEDYMSAMDSLRSGGESSSGSSFLLRKIKEASKERKDSLVRLPPPPKRGRVGRPRGSRSLGITRLRKAAAAAAGSSGVVISLSDLRMGAECGVGDCAVRMRSAVNLERHRKSHADPESAVGFRCTECQAENTESSRFEYWSELALHLWRKHRVDMELFRCEECEGKNDGAGFRCFTQARLQNHMLSHRKDRPCLCSECGRGFKTKKTLRAHQKTHSTASEVVTPTEKEGSPDKNLDPSSEKTTCHICQRNFKGKRRLLQHLASVHKKLRPHLCNYCGYAASNRSTLRLHLRSLHTHEKPYSCDSCDYKTADHNSLRRHKMRHSGEKPYKCPHCSYASIQCSTFKVHLRSKHPDRAEETVFQCSKCVFKTVSKGNFQAHLAQHHGEAEVVETTKTVPSVPTSSESLGSSRAKVDDVLVKKISAPQEASKCHSSAPKKKESKNQE